MATITISGTTDITDTLLDQGSPTVNSGGDAVWGVGNIPATYRTLIKFSLANIPAGSTINSATFSFFEELNTYAINTRTLSCYRVLRAWTEGGATWNKFDGSTDWGTAGCANTTTDREAAAIGSVSIPSGSAVGTEFQVSLTASAVEEWLDGVLANNGLLLQVATESQDFNRFYSSEESGQPTRVPKLVVDYTPPGNFLLMF